MCVRTCRERAEFGCIRFGEGRCRMCVRTHRERAENAQRTRRVWLHQIWGIKTDKND